jgi:hypothetical protein
VATVAVPGAAVAASADEQEQASSPPRRLLAALFQLDRGMIVYVFAVPAVGASSLARVANMNVCTDRPADRTMT